MFKVLVKFTKIMIIACLIGVSLRVIDILCTKKEKTIAQIDSNKIITQEIHKDYTEAEENFVSSNMDKKAEQNKETNLNNNVETNSKNIENKNSETKKDKEVKITKENTESKNINDNNKQEDKKIEEHKKEEKKTEKQENNKVEEQKQVIKEEYKRNDEMIAKIKEIIKNNETQDMKEYGYEVVQDNTIPEITNEFTFTEKRVKDKLKFKSGIIKIYARDYYYNGNYISTQCFII